MKELFEDKLKRLNEDEITKAALAELFSEVTEANKPTIDGTDSDIGQEYKAFIKATSIIKETFKRLETFTYPTKSKPTKSRAI